MRVFYTQSIDRFVHVRYLVPWIGTVSCFIAAAGAAAQVSAPPQHGVSVNLATITTDTGAFAPGNKDFTRFAVPAQCIAAVEIARDQGRRTLAWQIALRMIHETTPERDTVPPGVATVAQACRTQAHFTATGVSASELPDLWMLALLEQNDTLAQAVLHRQLALAPNVAVKDTILCHVVETYLHATPARVTDAETVLARVDALPVTEQNHADPLPAHLALLTFAMQSFDEAHMRQEADWIIARSRTMPFMTIRYHYDPVIVAYKAQALLAFVYHPDSLLAVAQQAKQNLKRFPPGIEFPKDTAYSLSEAFPYKYASVTEVLDEIRPSGDPSLLSSHLKRELFSPQSVQAAYWYPNKPAVWPATPGQASLIIYGRNSLLDNCLHWDGPLLTWPLSNGCAVLRTYLPQWAKQYGTHLGITLAAHTQGSAIRSVVLPAAAEADSINWYLRTYLNLPITVAVVQDSVWQFPAPDDRHFWRDTTFYGVVQRHLGGAQPVLLFDSAGTLEWAGPFDPTIIRVLLARMFSGAGATVGSASPQPQQPKKE